MPHAKLLTDDSTFAIFPFDKCGYLMLALQTKKILETIWVTFNLKKTREFFKGSDVKTRKDGNT